MGFRLRAIGEHVPQFGKLGIAVLLHEPGDVVAAAPAARLAFDRQGGDAKVPQGVCVVSHASGGLSPFARARRLASSVHVTMRPPGWKCAGSQPQPARPAPPDTLGWGGAANSKFAGPLFHFATENNCCDRVAMVRGFSSLALETIARRKVAPAFKSQKVSRRTAPTSPASWIRSTLSWPFLDVFPQ